MHPAKKAHTIVWTTLIVTSLLVDSIDGCACTRSLLSPPNVGRLAARIHVASSFSAQPVRAQKHEPYREPEHGSKPIARLERFQKGQPEEQREYRDVGPSQRAHDVSWREMGACVDQSLDQPRQRLPWNSERAVRQQESRVGKGLTEPRPTSPIGTRPENDSRHAECVV